eukprot:TRINITY_DN5567_c0_g1_i3.p1 TRINITY_DN5567_c0_g1~~TRINITY_DN5567_c0_g1_i3.p1  ORF type:complete len:353 (-),score=53.15 TRINITY_DN5567_c0_g1_i3:417-1475(-)
MIVPSVVAVIACFSRSLSIRRELHKLQQQNSLQTNKTAFCNVYEVCKCTGDSEEKNVKCEKSTCSYAPNKPFYCCEDKWWCRKPKCKKTVGNWEDCEWANFQKQGDFPNTSRFMDVPKKPVISWTGITGVQVYTDVDDTIVCSGGGLGGADTTCKGTKPHGFYPKVGEFQLALAKGPQGTFTPLKVIPVSARPSELKLFLKIKAGSEKDKHFQKLQPNWGFNVDRALYGSLVGGAADQYVRLPWVGDTDLTKFDKMAIKKYRGWKESKKDKDTVSIFVGDNGQGDAVAAQMMLKASQSMQTGSGEMRASFIHDVVKMCSDQDCRDKWAKYGIYVFGDYEEAFTIARKNGLIP